MTAIHLQQHKKQFWKCRRRFHEHWAAFNGTESLIGQPSTARPVCLFIRWMFQAGNHACHVHVTALISAISVMRYNLSGIHVSNSLCWYLPLVWSGLVYIEIPWQVYFISLDVINMKLTWKKGQNVPFAWWTLLCDKSSVDSVVCCGKQRSSWMWYRRKVWFSWSFLHCVRSFVCE